MSKILAELPVLDKGYVQLLDYMGDEDAPVDAARVSFDKTADQYTEEENDRLLRYLLSHHHESPFEMVVYKFRVNAPVVVWWQWVRHRLASYNFVSGRYVPFAEDSVYHVDDDMWRKQSKSNKQGSAEGEYIDTELGAGFNKRLRDIYGQSYTLYNDMLEAGIAREQARLAIPFAAVYYPAIVMVNARSLANFLDLRLSPDAQWEIRQYANAVKRIVVNLHRRIWEPYFNLRQ